MKLIPLTHDKCAKVSDEDYEFLMQWKWFFSKGYALRMIGPKEKRKAVFMHRVIAKTPKGMVTDHKDMDTLNNQRENLRACTHSQNTMNRISKNGHRCIRWRKQRWVVEVVRNKKSVFSKTFLNFNDAVDAYNQVILRYDGEFARPISFAPDVKNL